jgi:hypothetical protein
MLQIAVKNEATAVSNTEVEEMLPAFDLQWNRDLQVVWGVEKAKFTFVTGRLPADSWWIVFLDNSDQAGALAYHDLTNNGLPLSKVFIKTILADKASVSVGATHEVCEMAVDPWLNGAYQDMHGRFWASEICDPVEDDQYGYKIGNILVTDFVTPNWFSHPHAKGKIDFKGHVHVAFEVLSGGYAQYYHPHHGWAQVTGHKARGSKRANAAEGSRRERRMRQALAWSRSEAKIAD